MPISKYNNDGTVDIYNSKTGEVRTGVQAGDLGAISPKLVAEYQAGQAPEKVWERTEAEKKLESIKKGEPEPMDAASAKLTGAIKSGLTSTGRIKETLGDEFSGGNLELIGARTPLTPWGRGLESDIYNLADAILRLRTGAAAPEEEVKRFMKVIGPSPLDPPDVRKQKLETAELELRQVAESLGVDPDKLLEEDAVNQATKDVIPSFETAPTSELQFETEETKKKEDEVEPFLSPSTILSTGGDIAGELIGAALTVPTAGIVNPVTASAGLAGAGEFVGELFEGSDLSEATKQATIAGGVSAVTPAVIKLGAKAVKPIFKIAGNVLENVVGRNLTKMGNKVLQKTAGDALERGINVYDEAGQRGIASLPRDEALQVIKQGFNEAETVIKNGIEQAGDPVVVAKEQLLNIFDTAKNSLLETADQNAIEKLKNDILGKFGNELTASMALEAKREIFKKVASAKSGANKLKFKIAGQINDLLKDAVPAAKEGLREEEILMFMDDIFRRLRNSEFVKAPTLNPFFIGESVIRGIGPRRFAQLGQSAEKIGKGIKNVPDVLGEGAAAVSSIIRQPIRSLFTE